MTRMTEHQSSSVSRTNRFTEDKPLLRDEDYNVPKGQELQNELDNIFKRLEVAIVSFAKAELKTFHTVLASDYTECFLIEEEGEELRSRKAFLKITLDFLRRLKHEDLAEQLESRSYFGVCRPKLMEHIKKKFSNVSEGVPEANEPKSLNQFYTELHITEGGSAGINEEHEIVHIQMASKRPSKPEATIRHDCILKHSAISPITTEPSAEPGLVRTVITKGMAGIGKTVLTQKFSLDWAEGRSNQDIQLLFPFSFRELNILKDKKFSLVELLHHFFNETIPLTNFEDLRVMFIFDGLDEFRLSLNFTETQVLTEATESGSVETLLVNLIRGKLLPSACLWITSRPAAANQIPHEYVDRVTEVRGFTNLQKEEYFTNRFRDEQQAADVLSHIKDVRTLYIMCHIPIFCWIISIVFSHVKGIQTKDPLPKTLTQMYIHFLLVQVQIMKRKYDEARDMGPIWSKETRNMVTSLGKLAFEQLQRGNLIFYESDLNECGLDAVEASRYSGVFTQVFKEESSLNLTKVYCFIHLSVQEFLAALHVHHTYYDSGINLFAECHAISHPSSANNTLIYQCAVDEALKSQNGHLDLFLRFFLGLSLPSNQTLLRGFLNHTSNPMAIPKTAKHIQYRIEESLSAERSINLFHCLNELEVDTLVKHIQQVMEEERLSEHMSPAQWSAVAFLLLSSDKDLEMFDLKKYCASEKVLLRLLPVIKASNKAILSCCSLSPVICDPLSTILSSPGTCLTLLDLSNNDLLDSGVKRLCCGLENHFCKLEILRLSGCLVSDEGGMSLASALRAAPFHLRELDVSYNNLGQTAMRRLTELSENNHCFLETLKQEPSGPQWMTSGLSKYLCDVTLDSNTANSLLTLSNDNRKVTRVKEPQVYPDHEHRFVCWPQVLCSTGLTGRCYWEVDWRGRDILIAMSYKGINRKEDTTDSLFAFSSQSWALRISNGEYDVCHNGSYTPIYDSPVFSRLGRLAVYLDFEAGSLSFYEVTHDGLSHLHTFNSTFTEPLFPGFGLWSGSSVSLVHIQDSHICN